jgi:hypothetical protein
MSNAFDTFANPLAASQGSLIPALPNILPDIGNLTNSAENALGLGSAGQGDTSTAEGLSVLPDTLSQSPLGSVIPNTVSSILNVPGRAIAIVIGIILIIAGLFLLGKSPIIQTVKSSGKALALAA